jgi:Right handed beta helix region
MARLRTLVAAGWVTLTIAGSVAVAPAATARHTRGVDATGATDVTADLQALIDKTPDGGVVQLERDGNYRVEGTLMVEDRRDLHIEGNGARILATSTGDAHRSHIRVSGGSGLTIRNLEIEGANPHAGLGDRAYVSELEFQHGISLEGATDVELDRVNVHDTYGDLVYISRHDDRRVTERVWIHHSTFARSGRQGIAIVDGRDIVIERNTFTDMRRATIDLEPTAWGWSAENVHIIDNEVGPGRLLFVAAAGVGPINRVVIARNTLRGRDLGVMMKSPEDRRRRHFWVVDNTSDFTAKATPLRFTRADGVIVHGNRQAMNARDVALVMAVDSCDVAITDNNIAPGTRAIEGRSRECNFILPVQPPDPPTVAGRGQEQATAPASTAPPTPEAAPTTTAPPTAPTTSSEPEPQTPTSSLPSSQAPEPLAAATKSADDGVAVPVVVLAVVLAALAGAGGVLAFSARRGPR